MTTRAKARRPLGLLALVAAIAFFIVSANPAGANGNGDTPPEQTKYTAGVDGDCAGGFFLTINNFTEHDVDASITLNGVVTHVEVEDHSHRTVPLTYNEDVANTLVVRIGDTYVLQKTFWLSCAPDPEPEAKLSASISSDCGNFAVTVKNDGDAPGTAMVTINGSALSVTVEAGKTVTMTAVVTEDADNTIAVSAGDTDLAHKTFHVNCKEEPPAPSTTVPPTTLKPAPAVEVLGETVQAPQPQTLAFTGGYTVFETFVGVALLGLGFYLMRSSRRLERDS
jgi:hypothetical protein